ncbi:hypothetical protein HNR45_001308 [Negativicoccus succinicivorans]|uniref:DUF1492 domain-containing protein n=1 Tax=Negativicoccus succinicivorans TaxID=620903 RepID=A0A841R638_9FIRM|nr:hypothetical protein [Negativicoccus succinicivorans]MBB6478238.1 hypothetical protein [Negativicoccus succinicivorans]
MIKGNRQARAELEGLRELNARIDALIMDKEKLAARATSLARPFSEPVSGTRQSDIANAAAKLADMDAEIDRTIDEYSGRKKRILIRINAITDIRYRTLLFLYYANTVPLRLHQVARIMHYQYSTIKYMHGCALDEYQQKYFPP